MDKAQFWVLLGNIALAPHMSHGWAIGFVVALLHLGRGAPLQPSPPRVEGAHLMSRRARARQAHEEARWLGFAPEPDDEHEDESTPNHIPTTPSIDPRHLHQLTRGGPK